MKPNTNRTIEDLTEEDCKFVIDLWHSFGMHTITAFTPSFLCQRIKTCVTLRNDEEYRPASGTCQNKLDISLQSYEEKNYLHFAIRANDEKNAIELNKRYDQSVRIKFGME